MDPQRATFIATRHLARDGLLLDRREWTAWLELYDEQAEYWVPAWVADDATTQDVDREVSLIYHPSRTGLEERVLRIGSRRSVTALPLPRTCHLVSNVLVAAATPRSIDGTAAFTVHQYHPRTGTQRSHFGLYEFRLALGERGWRYLRKKTVLHDDRIPGVVDFYSL